MSTSFCREIEWETHFSLGTQGRQSSIEGKYINSYTISNTLLLLQREDHGRKMLLNPVNNWTGKPFVSYTISNTPSSFNIWCWWGHKERISTFFQSPAVNWRSTCQSLVPTGFQCDLRDNSRPIKKYNLPGKFLLVEKDTATLSFQLRKSSANKHHSKRMI
jgi:hypothetical protein